MRRTVSLLSQGIPWIFLALSLAPLLSWAYLGFFTRYLADDYGTSFVLLQKGFWRMQLFWYQTWSGRYSFTFLVSLVELGGVKAASWIPIIALSSWFLSLLWALKQIFSALAISINWKWLGIFSGVILFGAVKSIPDYSEIVFWQTGILTYQVSNIFLALSLALFLKRFFSRPERPKVALWEYPIAFMIAFLIGGFSETWIGIQLALITLGLLYFFFYKNQNRNDILRMLLMAYLGSWCSLAVILKSPGNMARTWRVGAMSLETLSSSFISSLVDVPVFLYEWITDNTVLVLMLLLTGVFVGFVVSQDVAKEKVRHGLLLGLGLLGVACASLGAGFLPSYAVWGARPADRAIFIPMFIFVWAYVLFGFLAGRFLSTYFKTGTLRTYFQTLMLLSLAFTMVWMQARTTLASLQWLPALQTYARLWDERDAFLRQASLQNKGDLVIPSLRHNPAMHDLRDTVWMTGELTENKGHWINKLAALYYGVPSITGK